MIIPNKLQRLQQNETGQAWLNELPTMIGELAEQWGLQLGTPYQGSNVSFVTPAICGSNAVVLKIQWPHPECKHEAEALRLWNGAGAVRLLAYDAMRHALLLERCTPGTSLANSGAVDPLGVVIGLLPRLWKPANSPFDTVADEAEAWAATLNNQWEASGRPCERRLLDATLQFLSELPHTQGDLVLVHQDFHGNNILAAEREPWLVIDPKPLIAEREFSLAPIIRSAEFGHSRQQVVGRLNRLCAELNLNRERARRWAIAQAISWSMPSDCAQQHFETARWLLEPD